MHICLVYSLLWNLGRAGMIYEFFSNYREMKLPKHYQDVKDAGKVGTGGLSRLLNDPVARQGFWLYVLDFEDFKEWRNDCKAMLFKTCWMDALLTINDHPKAFGVVFAAASALLVASSFLFGTSASLGTIVSVTLMVGGLGYLANLFGLGDDNPAKTTASGVVTVHSDGGPSI